VLILLTLYAVKILPALILKKQFGWRKSIAAGILLSSRLSLIIAAATIGLDLEIISEQTNAVFILMAVITCLLSPVLYNQIATRNPLQGDKTIIVGGSSTAVLLARRLKMHGKKSVIIESNNFRYSEIIQKGLTAIYGNGLYREPYQKAGLKHSDHVVVLTPDNQLNLDICRFLRKELLHEKIITKSNSQKLEEQLTYMEVKYLDVTRTLATALENHILRPTAYRALVETFENFNIEEVTMTNPHYDHVQIKEMPLHPDVSFLLYKHDDAMDLPHGNTRLHIGDTIFVFGTDSALQDTRMKLVEG
jgi:Trk K+ transport system NAD-binding subunit